MTLLRVRICFFAVLSLTVFSVETHANAYREKGTPVKVANSGIVVTPSRDWNRLDLKPGKYAEIWTLDGEQLNEITFYGGVEANQPIVRERNKKREPLPKFTPTTLIIELPELLERTYRAYKKIGAFAVTGSNPIRFLNQDGVHFTYDYTDRDDLPRKGDARAVLIDKKLYMMTFDAPRVYYFQKTLADYQALADSAKLVN